MQSLRLAIYGALRIKFVDPRYQLKLVRAESGALVLADGLRGWALSNQRLIMWYFKIMIRLSIGVDS